MDVFVHLRTDRPGPHGLQWNFVLPDCEAARRAKATADSGHPCFSLLMIPNTPTLSCGIRGRQALDTDNDSEKHDVTNAQRVWSHLIDDPSEGEEQQWCQQRPDSSGSPVAH